jgi:hypothetical protein
LDSQVKVSLGQGVTAKLKATKPLSGRLGATYLVVYQVEKKAREGPRDLRFQFGGTQFHLPRTIYVAD